MVYGAKPVIWVSKFMAKLVLSDVKCCNYNGTCYVGKRIFKTFTRHICFGVTEL